MRQLTRAGRPGCLGGAVAAALAACSPAPSADAPPPTSPALGAVVQVVPSEGLPGEVTVQQANNNLDVIRHDGRVFLAFRTAPIHFASSKARLYVLSSSDEQSWRYEADFHLSTDLREPRFLSFDGRLFFYFAVLGDSIGDFAPREMRMSERDSTGQWSESEVVYVEGFIPWRIRVVDGRPLLIGYEGGEGVYDEDADPITIHWLTTEDGRTFTPAVGDDPVVLEGGVSEADFAFQDDGSLVAVVRNEAGDADGWGSKICRAEASALGDWECRSDPRKYDSPLLFRHLDATWLVGRRNVTESGHYDIGTDDQTHVERTRTNLGDYSRRRKRCALWRVDPETLTVEHSVDLPSRGDTCFASVLSRGEHSFRLYNYTSPLDGADLAWIDAQVGTTHIYRIDLDFR